MSSIQGAIGAVIDFATATIAQIQALATGVLNSIKAAIEGVMADIQDMISAAMSELNTWIDAEAQLLADMISELLDFSFLKGIGNFGVCGNAIMGKVIDSSKIDPLKIASI